MFVIFVCGGFLVINDMMKGFFLGFLFLSWSCRFFLRRVYFVFGVVMLGGKLIIM